jgi:hypothetical protein
VATTMKAVILREAGGPEVLKVERVPVPTPRPGEVLIRVMAFGLNRSELFVAALHDAHRDALVAQLGGLEPDEAQHNGVAEGARPPEELDLVADGIGEHCLEDETLALLDECLANVLCDLRPDPFSW